MTSQTYQTDDGQLMQDPDQVVLESHPTEPEAEPTVAEPDPAEPGADLTVAEPTADLAVTDAAEPDAQLGEPDANQTHTEDSAMLPVTDVAPEHAASATSLAAGYPGFSADSAGAEETAMADGSSGDPEPASAMIIAPEPVADASEGGPWSEIQAMFVDDPRASVERAAGLVDDRVQEYIESVKKRQRSLQPAWQAEDAGTEELRVALQHHRTFWNSLEDLPDQS